MTATFVNGSMPAGMAIHIEETRGRTTPRRDQPRGAAFATVVRGGAEVLLRGVEAGAGAIGGPVLGAAVREARRGLTAGTSGVPAGPLSPGSGSSRDATGGATDPGEESSTLAEVRDLQEQAQAFNAEYLALQEEVQQQNRQFTTISNILKAKHETAKAAIGNIRA